MNKTMNNQIFKLAEQFVKAKTEKEAGRIYKKLQSLCACQEEVDVTIMEAYENQ